MTVEQLGNLIIFAGAITGALAVIVGATIALVKATILRPMKEYIADSVEAQFVQLTTTNGGAHPADWMKDSQRDSAEALRLVKLLRGEVSDLGSLTRTRVGEVAHGLETLTVQFHDHVDAGLDYGATVALVARQLGPPLSEIPVPRSIADRDTPDG